MPKVKKNPETEVKAMPDQPAAEPEIKKNGKKRGKKSTLVESGPVESTSASASPEVIYPEPDARIGRLTVELAKQFLGWLEPINDEDRKAWAKDRHFDSDLTGPVRFSHNSKNRPIRLGQILLLQQEILRGRWRLNGEPIIIGKYGTVLDGQHTMIALVMAGMAWEASPETYPAWEAEPHIEKVVIQGIEEDDETVNTINTGLPRTDADVLYRTYFQDQPPKERRTLARMLAYATRFVWSRTGASEAFAPRRTHAETLEFVDRHQRLLECVKHIAKENGSEGRLQKYLSPGYAAGLMYLMAASSTDDGPRSYREVTSPGEDLVDFKLWKDAEQFWIELAAGDIRMESVREAFAELADSVNGGTLAEKVAVLVSGWLAYPKIAPEDLVLDYHQDENGVNRLASHPTCGGIDLGPNAD